MNLELREVVSIIDMKPVYASKHFLYQQNERGQAKPGTRGSGGTILNSLRN
jgi:hypothetical protein